jgi:hypothetical protein
MLWKTGSSLGKFLENAINSKQSLVDKKLMVALKFLSIQNLAKIINLKSDLYKK